MYTQVVSKADGRKLHLYSWQPRSYQALPGEPLHRMLAGHLRRHPLLGEWVIYAPHRQERTYHPDPQSCPFCPGGEVPFADFEIAVFDNRFPALDEFPEEPPRLPLQTSPARGRTEVVVYTPKHQGSLGTLEPRARRLLLRVWRERYRRLYELPEVLYVYPFENRGEEIGVTLSHPHGQIYAFPFVPQVVEREVAAFAARPLLTELWPQLEPYAVTRRPGVLAFVPPFARFPYEVWLAPEEPHPGLDTFSEEELDAFADLLGEVVRRLDALFARPMPYVLSLRAAPRGVKRYHFHVEIYPKRRSTEKLKYLAGTEVGVGVFSVDVLPEAAAAALREMSPA